MDGREHIENAWMHYNGEIHDSSEWIESQVGVGLGHRRKTGQVIASHWYYEATVKSLVCLAYMWVGPLSLRPTTWLASGPQ